MTAFGLSFKDLRCKKCRLVANDLTMSQHWKAATETKADSGWYRLDAKQAVGSLIPSCETIDDYQRSAHILL